ncbi:hypothetical protein [Hyphobacterium sp.]|jgi:hypothetical protein|uniref:hypothetical protein n=1 Tax=Hyphobacterium sp. TaxID=2004662 RepID=UPI003BADAC5C
MRQITDSDIENLNSAESGALNTIVWSKGHLRLNFSWFSIELSEQFELISKNDARRIDHPFSDPLPLGGLFGSSVESFHLEPGNKLVVRLDNGAVLRLLPNASVEEEQFVLTSHRSRGEEVTSWIII